MGDCYVMSIAEVHPDLMELVGIDDSCRTVWVATPLGVWNSSGLRIGSLSDWQRAAQKEPRVAKALERLDGSS